jgi:hypothetical protein
MRRDVLFYGPKAPCVLLRQSCREAFLDGNHLLAGQPPKL